MAKSGKSDVKQDAKLVRKGVGQHEEKMHPGKEKTKLKLGKTGSKAPSTHL